MAAVRSLCADESEFLRACSHRMRESYGPLLLLLRATSAGTMYRLLVRTTGYVSRVSRFEMVTSDRGLAVLRYRSERPESRETCLSRRAQLERTPSVFGLPDARVEERSCIARGDPCCEYEVRWHEVAHWTQVVLGAVAGLVFALVLRGLGTQDVGAALVLPVAGALAASLVDLRRANRANERNGAEVAQGFQALAADAAEARDEVLALTRRQEEWAELLEQQVDERTASLRQVVDGVKRMREERVQDLRGFSHDLRNPLAVLRSNLEVLDSQLAGDPRECVGDALQAAGEIDKLLRRLLESAMDDAATGALVSEAVEVSPLVDKLRRRMKAFVAGRDIRVSVFSSREAPARVHTDRLVFERVIDNLLSNAAKYTERGSILVELGGVPGMLCLKVSDTGSGISEERIDQVFGAGAGPSSHPDSHGVGLAGVVRLLARLGGRLEVMSKPGVGTTFWAYVPVEPPARPSQQPDDTLHAMMGRVVHIRRNHS